MASHSQKVAKVKGHDKPIHESFFSIYFAGGIWFPYFSFSTSQVLRCGELVAISERCIIGLDSGPHYQAPCDEFEEISGLWALVRKVCVYIYIQYDMDYDMLHV